MKKKSLLLIFSLFTLFGFCQQEVFWFPAKGRVYGDVMRIMDDNNPYVRNRIQGFNEGDINVNPEYWFNGFKAPANDFEWSNQSGVYYSQLDYPSILADKDVTTIILDFVTVWDEQFYDTAEYYYSKPVMECLTVNNGSYSENMLLVNPTEVTLDFRLYASLFNLPAPTDGDDRIDGIVEVIDGNVKPINIADTRNGTYIHGVDLSSLSYGLHELEYYAYGQKSDVNLPDEFSDKIKIRILIFDFKLRYDEDYAVCKCDTAYDLEGMPEGGIFSGECVVGSSNVFNPGLTQNATTLITYKYPVDGIYYNVERTVSFDPLPVIAVDATTLAGFPHEACGFEHGAVYEVTGTGFEDLFRLPPLGIIKQFHYDGNKLTIDWKGEGDGSIYVTALSDKGCSASLEHMVHITFNRAPEDSAYVTLYDRMLFCNADTASVKVFDWYGVIGGSNVFYERTTNPYYVLDFIPAAGDSFYVLTADDTTSCSTHSHIYTKPAVPKSDLIGEGAEQPAVKLFPNPVRGDVNCEILKPVKEGRIIITDVLGRQISRINHDGFLPGEVVRLETGDFKSGIYYVVFSGNNLSGSYKFIVY